MSKSIQTGRLVALTALLLLAFCWAPTAQAQMSKRISVNLKSASIEEFFSVLNEKAGIDFIMTTEEKERAPKVTVNDTNQPAIVILRNVLGRLGYNYRIDKNVVSIHGRKPADNVRRITGTITDIDGAPLPGAQVHMSNTKLYVVADDNGHFAIDVPTRQTDLVFSFVGMRKKTLAFKAGQADEYRDVQLRGNTDIDEVVVTGYQDFDKSRMAASIAKISAKDLNITGFNSLEQALQGKLAGVAVTNQSGMVGVKQRTRVRGTSTMLGSQEPIWVVDGVIQEDPLPFSTQDIDAQGGINSDNFDYIRNFVGNSISWLNPMDIDRITVLKDASATAIYGVRAANGVIVINTKRGKVGSMAVSYSGGINVGQRVSYNALEMMNSKERVAVSREIFERGLTANWSNNDIGYAGALNRYLFHQITADQFEAEVAQLEVNNTDWFKLLYRNPVSQNHSVSFSGGSEKARYYASLSYNDSKGTAIGNGQSSYGAHVGLNMDFSRKLHVSADVSTSYSKTNGFFQFDPYNYAMKTNRAIPAYNADGSLFYYQNRSTSVGNYGGYLFNALNERDQTGNRNKNLAMTSSINAYYDITDNIKFNTLFSFNVSSVKGQAWATERSALIAGIRRYNYGTELPTSDAYKSSPLPQGGELQEEETNQKTWSWRNSLQYDKVFNEVHAFTAMVGMEMSSVRYDGYKDLRYGYLPERGKSFATVPVQLYNSYSKSYSVANDLLTKDAGPTLTDTKTNNMGLYLTLNYAYDNRYVVNLNVRGDASNRFGQYHNEKFNPVWAGGVRWNLTNEQWFKKQNIVSDASIYASFGFQRNMASNYSPSLILSIPTGAASQIVDQRTGDYLLNIKNLPYDDLRWEKTFSQNYSIDLGLFDNKIRVGFEYYYKKGTDMITTLQIPREYGIEYMPVNGGSMKNSGYELTVGFTPIRTKDFTWNVSINTSKNNNEVTKVGLQNMTWLDAANGNYYKKGAPVTGFWAFKFDGIDPTTGYPKIDLSVDEGADTTDPTSYMEYAGKITPDFTGGLSMGFRYKDFNLSTTLYLQLGGKKFLQKAYESVYLPSEFENLSNELLRRWQPGMTDAEFPGLPDAGVANVLLPDGKTYANVYEMYNYSTARVVNASSLSCNNLSLSYNFPYDWVRRTLHVQSLSLGANITNLFIIHSGDFHGRDPEVAMGQQPRTRALSFNLNVAF